MVVKCGRRYDQNRCVNKQASHQRDRRVPRRKLYGLPFTRGGRLKLSRLNNTRMEVKIVRHHCRAQDADGDVEHVLVLEDLRARHEPMENRGDGWF